MAICYYYKENKIEHYNETRRGLLPAEQLLCIEPSETPTWKSLTKCLTFYK